MDTAFQEREEILALNDACAVSGVILAPMVDGPVLPKLVPDLAERGSFVRHQVRVLPDQREDHRSEAGRGHIGYDRRMDAASALEFCDRGNLALRAPASLPRWPPMYVSSTSMIAKGPLTTGPVSRALQIRCARCHAERCFLHPRSRWNRSAETPFGGRNRGRTPTPIGGARCGSGA